jgi:hypothetical protein
MDPNIKKLVDAVAADDEKAGIEAVGAIASQLLEDVRRITAALEAIAANWQKS